MSLAKFRQALMTSFSDRELKALCFDLDIDYETLPGESKDERAVELLMDARRRNKLPALAELCAHMRPDIAWRDYLAAAQRPPEPPEPPKPQPDPEQQPLSPLPTAFQPVGRWQIRVGDAVSSVLTLDLYPNGACQGMQQSMMNTIMMTGQWGYLPGPNLLQLQGFVNGIMPFALAITVQNADNGSAYGVGGDGFGYWFTRMA
jgi:Effector-associated domain 7